MTNSLKFRMFKPGQDFPSYVACLNAICGHKGISQEIMKVELTPIPFKSRINFGFLMRVERGESDRVPFITLKELIGFNIKEQINMLSEFDFETALFVAEIGNKIVRFELEEHELGYALLIES